MTEYVVLEKEEGWLEYGRVNSRSAQSAIKAVMDHPENQRTGGGTFVAVPARSWKPVTVKVETKTALKFS